MRQLHVELQRARNESDQCTRERRAIVSAKHGQIPEEFLTGRVGAIGDHLRAALGREARLAHELEESKRRAADLLHREQELGQARHRQLHMHATLMTAAYEAADEGREEAERAAAAATRRASRTSLAAKRAALQALEEQRMALWSLEAAERERDAAQLYIERSLADSLRARRLAGDEEESAAPPAPAPKGWDLSGITTREEALRTVGDGVDFVQRAAAGAPEPWRRQLRDALDRVEVALRKAESLAGATGAAATG